MPQKLSEPQRILLEHLKGIIFEEGQPILVTDRYWTKRLAELIDCPENKLFEALEEYAKKKKKLIQLYEGYDRLWKSSITNRTFSEIENINVQSRIERLGAALVKAKIEQFEKLGIQTPYSLEAEFHSLMEQVKKLNQKALQLRQKKNAERRPRKRPQRKP